MNNQNFYLFEKALQESSYINLICSNEDGENQFLTSLSTNPLTFEEIISLITSTPNRLIQSLIIFHILRTAPYLDNLEGDSLLLRLRDHKNHKPSRLNALIQMLDLSILSPKRIEELQPEAAVSILCSIPHFHQFQLDQLHGLFNVYPESAAVIVDYWLHHFYAMPNAYVLFSQLLALYPKEVINTTQSPMYKNKKLGLCRKILEHLELFMNHTSLLQGVNEEEWLALAIQLFLNGHDNLAYKQYILLTADKLLNNSHVFSLQTTQQLIALQSQEEFHSINKRTAYLTNYYLRKNAQTGDVGLFYTSGQPNIESMIQPVDLKPITPELTVANANDNTPIPIIIENTVLIDNLAKHEKKVRAFDYFLMHYNEKPEQLINMAINDYLAYFSKNNLSQCARTCASFILRPEINTPIKEALFTAFLQYPTLHDEEIVWQLMQFDASRLFQYFGKQGTPDAYEHLIKLSNLLLQKKLNEKQITLVTQVKAEATFELGICNDRGFFSPLIHFIKRCWFYGWNGFFKPNQPLYVIPLITVENSTAPTNGVYDTPHQAFSRSESAANKLYQLLTNITTPYTIEYLDAVIEALKQYSLQEPPINEGFIRTKMDALFPLILLQIKQDIPLGKWFAINSTNFVSNRFRLIELQLYTNNMPVLSQIDDGAPLLRHLKNELTCELPKSTIKTSEKTKLTNALVNQKNALLSKISKGMDRFFSTAPRNYQPTQPKDLLMVTNSNALKELSNSSI